MLIFFYCFTIAYHLNTTPTLTLLTPKGGSFLSPEPLPLFSLVQLFSITSHKESQYLLMTSLISE